MIAQVTLKGGHSVSGTSSLSHAERLAAHNVLSKLKGAAGAFGSGLGESSRSATLIGGATKATGLAYASVQHGVGSDTFVGGARSFMTMGNDTVLSGSSAAFERSGLNTQAAHSASSLHLSSDTINAAGATALSVKGVQPETKSHTVTLGDKTTVTISGLSSHDITKLGHA